MDSKEITAILGRQLFESGHSPICANFQTIFLHECDIISVNANGYLHEYEIKVSASDFKADFKKKAKHQMLKSGPYVKVNKKGEVSHLGCSYFTYVCPACLIREDQVPPYAGLIWIHADGRIDHKIQAPQLHKYKSDAALVKKISHNLTQKHLFGSSYMTVQNKEAKEKKKDMESERRRAEFQMLMNEEYFNPDGFTKMMFSSGLKKLFEECKAEYVDDYNEHLRLLLEKRKREAAPPVVILPSEKKALKPEPKPEPDIPGKRKLVPKSKR